jgi:hypothetical protein
MKRLRCDDDVCADDTVGDFRVDGRLRCAFKSLAGLWESTSREMFSGGRCMYHVARGMQADCRRQGVDCCG